MPSSASINWTPWIIAGIMGLVVVLVISGVIGYFVYRYYYSGKKLPTPVGDLTITKAPYFDFNAAPLQLHQLFKLDIKIKTSMVDSDIELLKSEQVQVRNQKK